MNNEENMNESIDSTELMLRKTFEALSNEERQHVLNEMTEEDYNAQRAVILQFESMSQEESLPEADADILWNLRQAQRNANQRPNLWAIILLWLERPCRLIRWR